MKIRGFEKISSYKKVDFPLPSRQTARSAGYDIYLPETVTIPAHGQKMVPTGVKAYMQDNEYLGIHIRSSMAVKRHLRLVNKQGIGDAGYYNNPDKERHLLLVLAKDNGQDVDLEKGETVGQGDCTPLLYDRCGRQRAKQERSGGFGSTTK